MNNKIKNEIKNEENYYVLPRFDKHERCNCAVCRYVKGVEELLGASEFNKYSQLLSTIEGDYKLANIEELEELSMENYELKEKVKQLEKDYQYLQKTNWENINYLNGKIEKLEKKNAALKQENYAMNGLLNGKGKEIVKDLQKLKDVQNECDTCMKQEFTLVRLEKENAELKKKNDELTFCVHEWVRLNAEKIDKIDGLKSKLDNIKTLNRQEVEKFVNKIDDGDYIDWSYQEINKINKEELVTAICNLAIPDEPAIMSVITETDIVEVLGKYADKIYDDIEMADDISITFKKIAKEILQDKGWEVIDRMKIYEGNKVVIEFDCKKYLGKNIVVAVKEVEHV